MLAVVVHVVAHIFLAVAHVLAVLFRVLLAAPATLRTLRILIGHRVPPVLPALASDQTIPDPLSAW
jgi:hypothetical protein